MGKRGRIKRRIKIERTEGDCKRSKKGKQEGLKEGILGIIQVKFGSRKANQIKNLLDRVNDINLLEKIKTEAIRAKTWDDFIKLLKNSISKNKNSKGK
jgi:hypothetical protein